LVKIKKMGKSKDHRINKVNSIKKGKFPKNQLKGLMKYNTASIDREYILSKLSPSYTDIFYSNPLPEIDFKICQEPAVIDIDSNIITELIWNLDTIIKYSKYINAFLILEKKIENHFLLSQNEQCFNVLNDLDDEVCHSLFAINTEFLINEFEGNTILNDEILKDISEEKIEAKLFVTLQIDKLRIEKKFSSWQYDAVIDQEKLKYLKDSEFVDYITYKYDPTFQNTDEKISNLSFIIGFESDFSVIDRYKSIQKIIPLIISQNELNGDEQKIFYAKIEELNFKIQDSYWQNLSLIGPNTPEIYYLNNEKSFYLIQDHYFSGAYEQLKKECKEVLSSNPRCSEIYLFFLKSIIITNDRLENYISEKTELYKLLNLIKTILEKGKNYLQDRQSLLDYFYSISHFKFSHIVLEFLIHEYSFTTSNSLITSSILNISPIRYNFFNHYNSNRILESLEPLSHLKTYAFFFKSNLLELKNMSLFAKQLFISKSINNHEFEKTLNLLNEFEILEKEQIEKFDFIDTWLNRKYLNCYFKLNKFSEFSDLIINSYFKKDFAYDHYFKEDIVESILECDNNDINKNINIPILFEIYNQPQTVMYDSLANFLIAHSLYVPSELFNSNLNFTNLQFIHFFERVCTKENIEDSPFINTIEEVENERILILNHLKILNPDKTEEYNEEILKITTESSIRIGLLQIHESRIYVDTLNIFKIAETHYLEIFERYLSFTDTNLVDITSVKLNENYSKGKKHITYYFENPIDEELLPFYEIVNNPNEDPNAIIVPNMRVVYFTTIFNSIKQLFIFDESYGFKGYLSMRIRHGTFTNVLRSVFDKHKLVSQLQPNSFEYKKVKHWNEKFDGIPLENLKQIQELLKNFSGQIDRIIEEGLLWINVQSKDNPSINAVFDFDFDVSEIKYIFINRVGRVTDFTEFVNVIFDILYEKLESNLMVLRNKISNELTPNLITALDSLNQGIQNLNLHQSKKNIIQRHILSCRTDILIVTNEVNNWFKISYNKSIEEFPLEMIIRSSLKYIDIINTNGFTKGNLELVDLSLSRFNGKYFESFGDIFINLFDNIISKNRDLGEDLDVKISIKEEEDVLTIIVKNNLSPNTIMENLSKSIEDIRKKIDEYDDDSPVGFEKGSGFLKICKSITVGLNQKDYKILPTFDETSFEVKIEFNIKDLIV